MIFTAFSKERGDGGANACCWRACECSSHIGGVTYVTYRVKFRNFPTLVPVVRPPTEKSMRTEFNTSSALLRSRMATHPCSRCHFLFYREHRMPISILICPPPLRSSQKRSRTSRKIKDTESIDERAIRGGNMCSPFFTSLYTMCVASLHRSHRLCQETRVVVLKSITRGIYPSMKQPLPWMSRQVI